MDKARLKAQSLLDKLHVKYGMTPKSPVPLVPEPEHAEHALLDKEPEDRAHVGGENWYLVDSHSSKFRLPKTMLFLGREECDIIIQVRVYRYSIKQASRLECGIIQVSHRLVTLTTRLSVSFAAQSEPCVLLD
ncbi:hypothetical protein C0Q70_13122 [Pomacea canaliculata]|uniref:Uncharacterized protein n=1 Tax=Pomacea canaliculata TaxID=400727 RepID=A0A2T7NWE0_POMCA|nr:hypothetical protein C0Q70_13122 [Pomacea canaliculata]